MPVFALEGSYALLPSRTGGSFAPNIGTPISERMNTALELVGEYLLTADAVQAVSFGGLTDASVVIIEADYKIRARITSTDGAQQSIPVDPCLILMSMTVPATAIDLTRLAGRDTTVRVFLAERA